VGGPVKGGRPKSVLRRPQALGQVSQVVGQLRVAAASAGPSWLRVTTASEAISTGCCWTAGS
jgi:hypothetical protein